MPLFYNRLKRTKSTADLRTASRDNRDDMRTTIHMLDTFAREIHSSIKKERLPEK